MMWHRGGQWQIGGVLNARCWVTWQSRGCEGTGRPGEVSSTLNVKWRGKGGRWETKGVLNTQRWVTWQSGGCEGSDRPGKASSTLSVKWRGRGGQEQTRGGVLNAQRRVMWQSRGWGQWQAAPASVLFERYWGAFLAHIFWGRGTGDGGGRHRKVGGWT